MNRRERLRRCYFHEELDRPAVYTRTGYPGDDPSYDRLRAFMGEHSELKAGWNAMRLAAPLPTEERAEPISADWERRITTLHTPAGDLTASRRVSLRGQPGLPESYFVSTREDAEKYLSLPDPVFVEETDGFFAADRAMGERGIVEAHFGLNAAGYVAGEVTGSESFALLSVTDRDVLHALCERRMAQMLARLKWLIARGVGPVLRLRRPGVPDPAAARPARLRRLQRPLRPAALRPRPRRRRPRARALPRRGQARDGGLRGGGRRRAAPLRGAADGRHRAVRG